MTYQLILQFRGESLPQPAVLADLGSRLKSILGASEEFDGQDVGTHGANFFIYTASPKDTFQRMRALLGNAELASGFTAAYRTVAEERFRVIWPENATAIFNLRGPVPAGR